MEGWRYEMIIAVGTKNPAKVNAVKETLLRERGTIVSVEVESNVANQPLSEVETMTGALNRARASLAVTDAVLGFGLEGGVVETETGMMLCNWGALCHENGGEWIASGAKIPVPVHVAERLRAGEELGAIMEGISGDEKIRKTAGAIGWYTAGWVNRKEMFIHVVKLLYGQYVASLDQFKH